MSAESRGMAPGQPWPDMPETKAANRLRASGAELETGDDSALQNGVRIVKSVISLGCTNRAACPLLTFLSAMDRARDAIQLWTAGVSRHEDHPESFDVSAHELAHLQVDDH